MGGARGLCAGPRRSEFLAFFRRNDSLDLENIKFIRVESFFQADDS